MEHDCKYEEIMKKHGEMLTDIHKALLGTLAQPESGALHRIGSLERWRGSMTTRIKTKWAWVWGFIGIVCTAIVSKVIEFVHFGKGSP